jgi:geranylgeranylglycerol-phosphate geranylgeranyltransferase
VAYLRIIRPVNCFITLISVLVGGWIGQNISFSATLLFAGLIGFVVCAFGNIVNDIRDIEIDRINNPKRPLASGALRKKNALLMAIISFILAALGSFFLEFWPIIIVITALLLLLFYSIYLKKTLAGNLTVAVIAGMSFVLGGLVTGNPVCIVPVIFSVFIHLPREIVKDVIDMKGDKIIGAVTVPIIAGPFRAYNISALLLGLLCLVLPLPYVLGILNVAYIIIVLLVAYPLILYIIWRLLRKPSPDELPVISKLIKASMAIGLIAMIVS